MPNTIKELWNSSTIERLFASTGIGFVVVAPDQHIVDASPVFCSKLGYSLEEMLTMKISDYTHPDDMVMTSNHFQQLEHSNLVITFEKRYIKKSGEIMWCKIRSEAVSEAENSIKYRIAMIEDITREKLDEIILKQMATITEASDDAIFRCGLDGKIEFWGKGAENMYGYTSEEALGKPPNFIAAETEESKLHSIRKKLSDGEVVRDPDATTIHKNGSLKDISALIFPIKNKDGQIVSYATVHRDISDFKQLEVQFQHSQRLETAGLLAGGIAHDFNNIITVIQGASNLLAHEFEEGSISAKHLNLIERSADRATRLTRQLLAFSRKQKISPTIIYPDKMINESINLLSRTLGDHITLETLLNSHWSIREDATQLEQVMLNLAVNARHAMPNGGILQVTTQDITLADTDLGEQEAYLHYSPAPILAGQYVLITVKDSGCGMSKNTLEHIFDPFFTTKPKGEGTGLGLSVVYGMITQIGGGINVLTQENIGSEFQIYLPRVEGPESETPEQHEAITTIRSGKILVLEDDEGVRTLTSALLEDAGYTVFQAEKPRDILDGKVETDVDLILSDVMMPDMSGPEFAERWLEDHPKANFLFMSGYYEDDTFTNSMRGKILIQKPFKPSVLLKAVANILDDIGTQ